MSETHTDLCDIVGDLRNIVSELISKDLIAQNSLDVRSLDKLWDAIKRLDYFLNSQNLLIRRTDMRRWTYNFRTHDVEYGESLSEAICDIICDIQNIKTNIISRDLIAQNILDIALLDKLWDVLKRSYNFKIVLDSSLKTESDN